MVALDKQELLAIEGGVNFTGTLVNSLSTMVKTIASLGRNLGSAIRRIGSNKLCSL